MNELHIISLILWSFTHWAICTHEGTKIPEPDKSKNTQFLVDYEKPVVSLLLSLKLE